MRPAFPCSVRSAVAVSRFFLSLTLIAYVVAVPAASQQTATNEERYVRSNAMIAMK